jgi:hypothetical protein
VKSNAEGGVKFYKIYFSCAAFSNAMLADVDVDVHALGSCIRRNNFANA